MNSKFVQCESCEIKIPLETCGFATCRTEIDGKEHVFCCALCAEQYQKEKKK